ncbi:asparaginyl-tRNA synthetase [Thalassoporum mexicanum PCC 7367]|uniref:asparagine--tRNA ligase n=1 Tax=Thalassoporum mexicanum TaxID=3457544 RepID=UPI00029FD9FD|nr:asparagine--tRNA ligase [Pseudanabaena sp. PCC 7367]AFY71110.1 asparaginyl-tRNA synthetase [Pseudanabaena sp. PCC 7367]
MNPSRIIELLRSGEANQSALVQGWVRTKRESKELTFLEINDGSSLKGLQIIVGKDLPDYADIIKQITTGASIAVAGQLVDSPAKGQRIEMQADQVTVFGTADAEQYPLQKKRHSFEFLRTIAHLRPRTNTLGAVFRVRNACAYAIHRFFQERGFIWVHTPIITASDCEGAGEMFAVTAMDLANVAKVDPKATPNVANQSSQSVDFSQDFFGKPTFLTVSGQLEAEIMAMAFSNVYTFGPTFRAENSNTSRHLAEFWMIEPEMAFCDLEGDADLAEAFLKYIFSYVLENCPEDMAFFQQRINDQVMSNAEKIINEEFERISYTKAIEILLASSKQFEFPVEWGIDLQSEHERYLAEDHFQKPVIIMDYPAGIKAFYMRLSDESTDKQTVRAMDVIAPGIGEIIGGSQREERLDILEARLKAKGLDPEEYWWYLDLRRYGTVPHAGFGLGFERLVQFMTGMSNIRDVIPFPRSPQNAEF